MTSEVTSITSRPGAVVRPPQERFRVFLEDMVRHHVEITAQVGCRDWQGLRPGHATDPQRVMLGELMRGGVETARNCRLPDADIRALAKKMTHDKSWGMDISQSFPRRVAALYASFRLLSRLTVHNLFPRPKGTDELYSITEDICTAFFLLTSPDMDASDNGRAQAMILSCIDSLS
jgi:hypothetical protein